MARRALRGDELPAINALVDIGNIISLRHLIPAGGHAIDVLKGDIELRFATGDEEFVPFGTNDLEHPLPGEVIFVEGSIVLTRRWTWRQANHTLTLPETQAIEFNVDGLPPVTKSRDPGGLRGSGRPGRLLLRRDQPHRLPDGRHPTHLSGAVGRAARPGSGAAAARGADGGLLGAGSSLADEGGHRLRRLIGAVAHRDSRPLRSAAIFSAAVPRPPDTMAPA